nr:fasciclin domain-containing protein [Stakelama sediminis]
MGSTSTAGSSTPAPSPTPTPSPTPAPVMVGGAEMSPSMNIVENASKASNLTTLVSLVKAAGLVETLSGPGPFTVFAPTDAAFSRLPPGTVDTLEKPENMAALKKILTYHVVSGSYTTDQLKQMINQGGGTATLNTVEGGPLTLSLTNGNVTLTDTSGNKAYVSPTEQNVTQSNGMVQVINGVLVPKLSASASGSATGQ